MNAPVSNRPPMTTNRAPAQAALPLASFASRIRKGSTKRPPRIFLIGVEGVGKSTFGAESPKPFFLCAENGLVGTQFENCESATPTDWLDFLAWVEWLAVGEHDYKTLVLDTLDWIEPILFRYLCKRDSNPSRQLANIEDYGYGKGYKFAADEFRRLLVLLDKCNARGMILEVLAHSTIKAFSNPLGDNYDRFEAKASKEIAGLVSEWADAVLFAQFQTFTTQAKGLAKAKGYGGQRRIVKTTHAAGWNAKNRFGLPEEMEFDAGSILEAIASGNGAGGDSSEELRAEIAALSESLPENVRTRADADAAACTDPAGLARVLNKVRAAVVKYAPTTNNEEA